MTYQKNGYTELPEKFTLNGYEIRVLAHPYDNNKLITNDFIVAVIGHDKIKEIEQIMAPEAVTIDKAITFLNWLPQHRYKVNKDEQHRIYKEFQLFEFDLYDCDI